jgi:hypothetical protein
MLSDLIRAGLQSIKGRYDPEHDMNRDGPDVTWAEMKLVVVVGYQQQMIHMLEDRVRRLEHEQYKREATDGNTD